MTRVRADDYDNKKQVILDRAASLFAQKGFESTTMIEVAKACGATKSMLYHYFPSKESLLNAILEEHISTLVKELTEIVRRKLPPEERFVLFVSDFVERGADSRDQHLILMSSLKYLPEAEREQIRKSESQIVRLLAGLLKEINPALMASSKVQTPYAMLTFGMFIWTFTWYEKVGSISPKELAARISDLLLNGLLHSNFPR